MPFVLKISIKSLWAPVLLAMAVAFATGSVFAQEEGETEPTPDSAAKAPAEPPVEKPVEKADSPPAEVPEESDEKRPEEPEAETPSESSKESPEEKPVVEALTPVSLKDFMVLPRVGVYGRAPFHVDAIDAAFAHGDWKTPAEGDTTRSPSGRLVRWKAATADDSGKLSTRSIVGGYAATNFDSPADGVMLLDAKGHAMVYVNGEPHAGDPYLFGGYRIPVKVRKGSNELVFHVAQPQLHAKLEVPESDVMLSSDLATLPSVVRGEGGKLWGSVTLLNCSMAPLADATIVAKVAEGDAIKTPIAWLDGVGERSVAFEFAAPEKCDGTSLQLELKVVRGEETLAEATLALEVVTASDRHVRTFRSRIDRSVQSYAIVPAAGDDSLVKTNDSSPGCIVALHGAGVTASDFATHYQPKHWAHVIAPTGRGLYGFDWEDWARVDAIEALEDAKKHLAIDDQRIYVTGHTMGAHGALVLATTEPNRFAALGTVAAWGSLSTYGGGMPSHRNPTAVQAMLTRAASPSDTLQFISNLKNAGVYLLHGATDKTVPIEQSRLLLAQLAKTHDDFAFHEVTGAGNWWGKLTVDSPEMMEFFAEREIATESPRHVSFTAANLGISASNQWVTVAGQQKQMAVSHVQLERRDSPLSIVGTTKNVTRLSIDRLAFESFDKGKDSKSHPFFVRLDGGRSVTFRGMPASGKVWLEKKEGRWGRALGPKKNNKSPTRYGGFKAVFNNRVQLVYGTRGSKEENAWSKAKANFDAETFAYRGNGAIEVLPDTQFKVGDDRDRNVVLYGNIDTNGAWPVLLSTSPVQVFRNRVVVGARAEMGEDFGFLMVRPRPGSVSSMVGVVGGTGLAGMQLTNRLRYFVSGIAYPDLVILGPQTLEMGDRDIRAAGYFNEDWTAKDADIAWRDLAL